MSERDTPEQPLFKNDPDLAILGYLSEVELPSEEAIMHASEIIDGSVRAALGICLDLTRHVDTPTSVLAIMFERKHPALRENWKNSPNVKRTVVSMCAHLEIGTLHAIQISTAYYGGGKDIPDRIAKLTKLVTTLQEKVV